MISSALVTPPPVEILQTLVGFDTTNPPGSEAACIGYIRDLLEQHGIASQLVSMPNSDRPNLIARIKGIGTAAPIMMYGHVDVVTTQNQQWQHPPFAGDLVDGYVWGRGALDMKGGVAMMLSALLRAIRESSALAGDVLFVIVSDEESGGDVGAKYLVEEHPELFKDIHCAIGEFGGFTQYIGGQRFYPIQVAEKVPCKIQATIRGKGGHSSLYIPENTMTQLALFLTRLNKNLLPIHITPFARQFISELAAQQKPPLRLVLESLLNPSLTDRVIRVASRVQPQILDLVPLLRNMVNATIVQSGNALNVIPPQATVNLDARLLPGFTPEQLLTELRAAVKMDDTVDYAIMKWEPIPTPPFDAKFYELLTSVIKQADPDGIPVPLLLNASSDGRHFAKIGIQTYGYLPMNLPPDFSFIQTIHAADERIPVEALNFGTACLFDVLQHYGH